MMSVQKVSPGVEGQAKTAGACLGCCSALSMGNRCESSDRLDYYFARNRDGCYIHLADVLGLVHVVLRLYHVGRDECRQGGGVRAD
jgi:hypothetical protein